MASMKKNKLLMSQCSEKILVFILLACEIRFLELKISLAERMC